MDLLNLEELDDLQDVLEGRFADLCNISRLLDRFFNTDEVALVLVLTEHARLKLVHFHL